MGFFSKIFGSSPVKQDIPQPEEQREKRTLFRINKDKIPDRNGYYPIVCPHCLERFNIWEVEFRAAIGSTARNEGDGGKTYGRSSTDALNSMFEDSAPKQKKKSKIADDIPSDSDEALTAFPREIDEKNAVFLRSVNKLGQNEDPEAMNKILRIFDEDGNLTGEVERVKLMDDKGSDCGDWIYLEGRKRDDPLLYHKPLSVVRDKYGHNTFIRVCPRCHNEISNLFGLYPSYVIGVVGNTFCGKSVYLEKLIASIENGGLLSSEGGQRFIGIGDDYAAAKAKDIDVRARRGEVLLDPTRIEYIEPNVLNCYRGSGNNRTRLVMTFFDFPGEALQPDKEIAAFFDHYSNVKMNVDGWMFLFDSANFESVRGIIKDKYPDLVPFLPDNQINEETYGGQAEGSDQDKQTKRKAVTMGPMAVFHSFVQNFLNGAQFSVPVAFVITKSDVLVAIQNGIRELYPEAMTPNPSFLQPRKYTTEDMVNLDRIYNNSEQIQRLLGENGFEDYIAENVQQSMEREDESAWFAVSAMGTQVMTGVNAAFARPILVEEPLAWLLYMLGVLPGWSEDDDLWR